MNKLQASQILLPILKKGKPVNDIIFNSKKMTYTDIILMLDMCRKMKAKDLNEFVENPLLGGEYYQQLLFGCVAALEVYTEEEIITVLNTQQKFIETESKK